MEKLQGTSASHIGWQGMDFKARRNTRTDGGGTMMAGGGARAGKKAHQDGRRGAGRKAHQDGRRGLVGRPTQDGRRGS